MNTASQKTVEIAIVNTTGQTQMRVHPEEAEIVEEFAASIRRGIKLPAIDCFWDETTLWLADGFYRLSAHLKVGMDKIDARIFRGTLEDARWYAIGANKHIGHGVRRTNEDKIKAVKAALGHPMAEGKSDRQLAEHVGVSAQTVGKYREELSVTVKDLQSDSRTGRDGRTTNTANIGKGKGKDKDSKDQPVVGPGDAAEEEAPPPSPSPAPAAADLPPNQGDDNDADVPENLIPVFKMRGEFIDLEAEVRRSAARLQALATGPASHGVMVSDVDAMTWIAERVAGARPSVLCDDEAGWATVEEAGLDAKDIEEF